MSVSQVHGGGVIAWLGVRLSPMLEGAAEVLTMDAVVSAGVVVCSSARK